MPPVHPMGFDGQRCLYAARPVPNAAPLCFLCSAGLTLYGTGLVIGVEKLAGDYTCELLDQMWCLIGQTA